MLLDAPDLPDTIRLLSVVTLARTTENPIQQYCVQVLIRLRLHSTLQSCRGDTKSVLAKDYSKDPRHLVCVQGLHLPGWFAVIWKYCEGESKQGRKEKGKERKRRKASGRKGKGREEKGRK